MNIEKAKSTIAKLLSRGKSDNQHEAELAIAKAQQMAITYQIELSECVGTTEKEPFDCEEVFTWNRKPVVWKYIVHILQNHFNVTVIYGGMRVEFIGRRDEIEFAKGIAQYLMVTFDRFWKEYKEKHGLSNSHKHSFMQGMYQGLNDKLKENKKESIIRLAAEKSFGEVVSKENLIEKFTLATVTEEKERDKAVGDFYPRLRSSSNSYRGSYNPDSNRAGYSAGQSINIGGKVAGYLN
jgi:hypothetical protein